MIGGSTRVFAILGDPVSHSLSPAIHNAAFLALGIDAVYVALAVKAPALTGLLEALVAAGGGGNVTAPHKRLAASLVGAGDSFRTAINTFWNDQGTLAGANTDPDGVIAGWRALGEPPGDWLVIGTGGSAIGVAMAAARVGVGLAVRSRSPERARDFLVRTAELGTVSAAEGRTGLVVNCTPLGQSDDDALPVEIDQMPKGAAALDLVYRRGETPWVRAARAAGASSADGREVLLGQAVAAFRCWFPALAAPTEVMRAALARALR